MSSFEKYPVPGYHFEVRMGGSVMAFKEVSGLSATVEYKDDEPGADSQRIEQVNHWGSHVCPERTETRIGRKAL